MKKVSKSIVLALVVLLVSTSLLAACGKKTDGDTKGNGGNQGTEQPKGNEGNNETENKYGGVIKAVADKSPVTLFLPQSPTTGDRFLLAPAVEPLGRLNADGTTSPFLAKELITDAQNLTFTIKLRENVYFHDGSICDAEAVKWNLDKYLENGKSAELGNPVSVTATDALTVVIQYENWSNNWDTVIGELGILSKEAYEKNGEEWCKINAVGTGAFVLDSYVQDSHIKFKKNENYRIEGLPYLDGFEFVNISDSNTQISAFLNGEIDAMYSQDAVVIGNLKQQGFENIAQETANISNLKYVIFNSKDKTKPLGDLKVRQAVMHSIDWENIAKSLSGGLGYATPVFASPDSWAYSKEASLYEYNVELGKQLLAEAGYPDGFETKIHTISDYNDNSVALQASLAKIGIKAEIVTLDPSAMAAMAVKDNIEGFVIGRGSGQMDFVNNYIRLYSTQGIKNHGIIEFPADYEEALFGARAAKTLDEKKELLQKAAKMLVQDYCLIFPTSLVYVNAFTQKDVHDLGYFQVSGTQFTPEAAYRQK